MIHGRQSDRSPGTPQGGPGSPTPSRSGAGGPERGRTALPALLALILLPFLGLAGCDEDGGTQPGALRFGQLGSLEIRIEAPRRQSAGELLQVIRWSSSGAWSLEESISYRGLSGDARLLRSPGDPAAFASAYASLITQINEVEGLQLFLPDSVLPRDTVPVCAPGFSHVTVRVTDDIRNETESWTVCADGSLANLTPRDAGPTLAASRVVEVARIARNGTVGEGFLSQYAGSIPFGTLDRGQDTGSGVRTPAVFTAQGQFASFWSQHAPGTDPPEVDFDTDMVVAGIVGVRQEAGDSVEVRRILQVAEGSLVEIWERIPGDFCTPADRVHVPYHIVVSPRTPDPVRFADVRVETVPCGGS